MGDEFLLHDRFKVTEQWMDKWHSNSRLAENDKNASSHKNQSSVTPLRMGFFTYLRRSEYILFLRQILSKVTDPQETISIFTTTFRPLIF